MFHQPQRAVLLFFLRDMPNSQSCSMHARPKYHFVFRNRYLILLEICQQQSSVQRAQRRISLMYKFPYFLYPLFCISILFVHSVSSPFFRTQPHFSGSFWQLFLHFDLNPQSAQHTFPCLRSQLNSVHILVFFFFIFPIPFHCC